MEFKKKRENKNTPLEICKNKFKEGMTFNNGNIIDRPQRDVFIHSIRKFTDRISAVSMDFEHSPGMSCTFTMYKDGKYADIIT